MSWVTFIWSMTAGICLTFGAVHFLIWTRQRDQWANLVFSICAAAAAGYAVFDMVALRAQTPAEYGELWRWALSLGMLVGVLSAWFIRLYLRAGRLWLLWLICGLRALMLVLNFVPGPNFYFREITGLHQMPLLGELISHPHGVLHPWAMLMPLSFLLIILFALDAAHTASKRSGRRHAWVLGGVTAGGFTLALVCYALYARGILPSAFSSQLFLLIVLVMGYELSLDVLRAGQLSRELLDSQQRMRLAASAADLSLWEWDIIRDEIWVTEKGRERAGVGASERLNFDRLLQAVHPDDREQTQLAVRHSLEGNGAYEAEYRLVGQDGATSWVEARGQVEHDAQGKPLRLRGVSVNITERKKAEAALRESEARFRTVADTAPVLIWMSSTDKLCNFFNQGWLEFTGRTLEQEVGNGWAEGVHPDDLAGCLKIYGESFDARRSFTMEYRLRRRDGEYRWLSDHGVPRYDSAGNFLGYIGSCADLTERKQAEEEFRLVVEASPNGIVLADGQGRMVLVNTQTETLFGYPRAELIGQPVEMLLPERYRATHPGHRAGFFTEPKARAMGAGRELFARRKDGTEFPVEIGLSPIQTVEGLLVLTAVVDITERQRAEIDLDQQRNELAHLARVMTLSELSGSLAHELNQPLAIILTNAQAARRLLAQQPPDLAEARDILADIVSEDERAGEVIKRLRALLKPGQTQLQPLSASELVEDVLRIARSDLIERGIKVHAELDGSVPPVVGDRVQLQQVLLNLILNAGDAMAANPPPGRHLTLATAHRDGTVRVSVSDTGCGLPPDEERVFEPFYTTKKEGLGLGLSICRSIVTAHNGRLWADANVAATSRGTTFHVELPAREGTSGEGRVASGKESVTSEKP